MYIITCNFNMSWFATGLYGYPYTPKKHLTCSVIKNLYQSRRSEKWIVFGDFNLMMNSDEKQGGNRLDFHLTKLFNDTLNACDLSDLGYHGNKFTWANNQPNNIHIKERLDRFCANSNWIFSFPRYINTHLLRYTSDYNPILLEFHEDLDHSFNNKKTKIQRFENI